MPGDPKHMSADFPKWSEITEQDIAMLMGDDEPLTMEQVTDFLFPKLEQGEWVDAPDGNKYLIKSIDTAVGDCVTVTAEALNQNGDSTNFVYVKPEEVFVPKPKFTAFDPNIIAQTTIPDWMKEVFVEHHGEAPGEWLLDKNIMTMTWVLGGKMPNGDFATVEFPYEAVQDKLTPFAPKIKAAGQGSFFFKKTGKAGTLAQPKTGAEVFNYFVWKAELIVPGKLMQAAYAGKCPHCLLNIPSGVTIYYGSESPSNKATAWHPGCYLRALKLSPQVALEMDVRSADEMRWRRKAKAKCQYIMTGQDPTNPMFHKWACGCATAPWNITRQRRLEIRKKGGA